MAQNVTKNLNQAFIQNFYPGAGCWGCHQNNIDPMQPTTAGMGSEEHPSAGLHGEADPQTANDFDAI